MRISASHTLVLCLLLSWSGGLPAQGSLFGNPGTDSPLSTQRRIPGVLPADEAFMLQGFVDADGFVLLDWEIAEGHYLYRKSIEVFDERGESLGIGMLPEARHISDEFFGEVAVYFDSLQFRMPIAGLDADGDGTVELKVGYQGCAEDLYCYPPQTKALELLRP